MRLKGEPSGGTRTYRLAAAPTMNMVMAAIKAAVGMPKPTPAASQTVHTCTHTQCRHKNLKQDTQLVGRLVVGENEMEQQAHT